jgi:hypothetical protein
LINDVLVGLVGMGARFFWLAYGELIAAREQLARLARPRSGCASRATFTTCSARAYPCWS